MLKNINLSSHSSFISRTWGAKYRSRTTVYTTTTPHLLYQD